MQKINLEEILQDCYVINYENRKEVYAPIEDVKSAMIEFGKQLLELAAKNAKTYTETYCSPYKEEWDKIVDKQSILDTIKQVE